ncbi:hypothetical protein B4109_1573 [Geobacillus stearothermophilus]|uniref:Uncharacterized protein n=1 Tax=Geobacillus stearothermophilus TaxID=1422 RepID=A0A150N0G8_GEOSE|nr:hypothetical protein B4109_1573 [Geobacillus stearothermophilus]
MVGAPFDVITHPPQCDVFVSHSVRRVQCWAGTNVSDTP